jgi:hypothetical protein
MTQFSLSRVVVSQEGDRLYSFEYATSVTETSITVVERFVQLGLIEPIGSMLPPRDDQPHCSNSAPASGFRTESGGAAMVLDMVQESAQSRAQLKVYQSHQA